MKSIGVSYFGLNQSFFSVFDAGLRASRQKNVLIAAMAWVQTYLFLANHLKDGGDPLPRSIRKLAFLEGSRAGLDHIAEKLAVEEFDSDGFYLNLTRDGHIAQDFVSKWREMKQTNGNEAVVLQNGLNRWETTSIATQMTNYRHDFQTEAIALVGYWQAPDLAKKDVVLEALREQTFKMLCEAAKHLQPATSSQLAQGKFDPMEALREQLVELKSQVELRD